MITIPTDRASESGEGVETTQRVVREAEEFLHHIQTTTNDTSSHSQMITKPV